MPWARRSEARRARSPPQPGPALPQLPPHRARPRGPDRSAESPRPRGGAERPGGEGAEPGRAAEFRPGSYGSVARSPRQPRSDMGLPRAGGLRQRDPAAVSGDRRRSEACPGLASRPAPDTVGGGRAPLDGKPRARPRCPAPPLGTRLGGGPRGAAEGGKRGRAAVKGPGFGPEGTGSSPPRRRDLGRPGRAGRGGDGAEGSPAGARGRPQENGRGAAPPGRGLCLAPPRPCPCAWRALIA